MFKVKNGDGIIWPQNKRIAVMVTFDFDAELLRQSVIGKKTSALQIIVEVNMVLMKGWLDV